MKGFKFYIGDLMGLPTDENHMNFQWLEGPGKILFSSARQGTAMSIHIASDKQGLRNLERAINEFCDFIFLLFPWCDAVMGKIKSDTERVKQSSIERLAEKCGFEKYHDFQIASIYVRKRM